MRKILIVFAVIAALVTGCSTRNRSEEKPAVQRTAQRKVVVIVVDSLTNRSIRAASSDNNLAAFRYLLSHGHYLSNVVSSFPSMTVSDLSTVITGTYPEAHRIPGLVWFDVNRHVIVNYGNNFRQVMLLGTRPIIQNVLYNLNQKHLSKGVKTVFEELQKSNCTTGAINMFVYRGLTPHEIKLPVWARPFSGGSAYRVYGPDTFVFGRFTAEGPVQSKDGVVQRLGLNDDFATDALIHLIKQNKLPDFTMVYLPNNDTVVHKHGVDEMKGIVDVDKNLRKILATYGSWDETSRHLTLVVMGDGGVSPVRSKEHNPTILIQDLFPHHRIYRWRKKAEENDDIAIAVNSRMAYVYLLHGRISPVDAARQLQREKRIDIIAWTEGNRIFVTTPEYPGAPLSFEKGGALKDPYGQTWRIQGDRHILDIGVGGRNAITYGKYPDALQQLWSAAHCQDGTYLIATAKKGYQFGDEHAPRHESGAQQASLLDVDVYTPMVITGTNRVPKAPVRFVDLKPYFISLVQQAKAAK